MGGVKTAELETGTASPILTLLLCINFDVAAGIDP